LCCAALAAQVHYRHISDGRKQRAQLVPDEEMATVAIVREIKLLLPHAVSHDAALYVQAAVGALRIVLQVAKDESAS